MLLVIHPKGISETTQYALDQFVLRGGKLVAFVDPLGALDPQTLGREFGSPPSSSTLDKLLKAWGLTFEASKVLADMDYVAQLPGQGPNPAVLALNETAINKDDVVTADADNLFMVFGGVFGGTPAEGLKETVLLHSRRIRSWSNPMMAHIVGRTDCQVLQTFPAIEYPLAIRLTGKFKTAFPDGKTKGGGSSSLTRRKRKRPPPETMLKESTQATTVVLVGDGDMIQDPLAVREIRERVRANADHAAERQPGLRRKAWSSNSPATAISSRSGAGLRASGPSPSCKNMQADAEANYRSKIKELEDSLAETQRKMNELQRSKAGRAAFYSLAAAAAGAGEFPQERSRRENPAESKCARNCGPRSIRSRIGSSGSTSPACPRSSPSRVWFSPSLNADTLRCPMNSRQLALIVVLAVVLAAIGWILFHRGRAPGKTNRPPATRK